MQAIQHWPVLMAFGIIIAAGIHLMRRLLISETPAINHPAQSLIPNTEGLSACFEPKEFPQALAARLITDEDSLDLDHAPDDADAVMAALNAIPEERILEQANPPATKPTRFANAIPSRRLPAQMMMRSVTFTSPPPVLEALKVHAGRLVENIPRQMRVGCLQHVEVRVGDQLNPTMIFGLKGQGDVHVHDLPVVETMSVELFSPTRAFAIERCSEPAQLVQKNVLINTVFENAGQPFARWQWNVMPLRAGNHGLTLRISARVADSRGHPTSHTLVPDRDITIHVKVNGRWWARKVTLWLAGGLAAALIGAVIQDQVWPLIREALLAR